MKKKKEKLDKKQINLAAYEIEDMKYAYGPLWQCYYNKKYQKRVFRPRYISR